MLSNVFAPLCGETHYLSSRWMQTNMKITGSVKNKRKYISIIYGEDSQSKQRGITC